MKRSLLSRLRINGASFMLSALLLLMGIPLYQALVFGLSGYNTAISQFATGHTAFYLSWLHNHSVQFIIYRLLLIITFALLLTLPFSLYRIIIAQEIMASEDERATDQASDDENEDELEEEPPEAVDDQEADEEEAEDDEGPPEMVRGKGFAVLAVWAGMIGLTLTILGSAASTLYLVITSRNYTPGAALPDITFNNILSLVTNTFGIGLISICIFFFGILIARRGRNLWPGVWVTFGYVAIAITALLLSSAAAAATTPAANQGTLSSLAFIAFALWTLWLGIMLVRLKAET